MSEPNHGKPKVPMSKIIWDELSTAQREVLRLIFLQRSNELTYAQIEDISTDETPLVTASLEVDVDKGTTTLAEVQLTALGVQVLTHDDPPLVISAQMFFTGGYQDKIHKDECRVRFLGNLVHNVTSDLNGQEYIAWGMDEKRSQYSLRSEDILTVTWLTSALPAPLDLITVTTETEDLVNKIRLGWDTADAACRELTGEIAPRVEWGRSAFELYLSGADATIAKLRAENKALQAQVSQMSHTKDHDAPTAPVEPIRVTNHHQPHPRVLGEIELNEIMTQRALAVTAVCKMCSGEQRFHMSVPVQPDDTDELLLKALGGMERMYQEVYRIRGEIKVMLAEKYDMPDEYRNRLEAIIFNPHWPKTEPNSD